MPSLLPSVMQPPEEPASLQPGRRLGLRSERAVDLQPKTRLSFLAAGRGQTDTDLRTVRTGIFFLFCTLAPEGGSPHQRGKRDCDICLTDTTEADSFGEKNLFLCASITQKKNV